MVRRISCVFMMLAFGLAISPCIARAASRIEADPNKQYELTANRGPWMISVATFHSSSPDGVTRKGKSPEEAAHELILELRELGMPAYMYVYEPENELVSVKDPYGRDEYKKNLRRVRTVLVIAGNYADINDKLAQQWVKKLNPKSLQTGVVFQATEARPTPLSGAFLTINPLLSAEEVQQQRQDPLLVRLNAGENYSLYENEGDYTLVIAHFVGKSKTLKPGDDPDDESLLPSMKNFLKKNNLDDAGQSARELVAALRGQHDYRNGQLGPLNNIEAFVWHDRHESFVTVGSFTSKDDPAIQRYRELFGPRVENNQNGPPMVIHGHLSVSGFGKNKNEHRIWPFDPDPQVIPVPKRR